MATENEYSAAQIMVLEGLDPVRMRPGMYVGDVHDGSGLHHMLWEVVGNVVDLHLARRAAHLRVHVGDGWIEVEDDGPGFPNHRDSRGRTVAEVVFTTLCGSGTRDGHFPHVHLTSSFHGVGAAVVNALSAELEVETRTAGRVWRQRFERGHAVTPFEAVGRSERTGTRIRYRPDPTIFSSVELDLGLVRARLRELAFLNPSLTVRLQDETFRARGGLHEWVRQLGEERGVDLADRIVCAADRHEAVDVEAAIAWVDRGAPCLRTFVSQAPAIDGGTHVEGFWDGLRAGLGGAPGVTEPVFREALGEGLVAVLHVGLYDPRWGAPTRDRLVSPEARDAVREVVSERLQLVLRRKLALRRALLARLSPGADA